MTRRLATPRIGPKMIAAIEYAGDHPGTTQQRCALAIGPNGSHAFGARAVQRALRAGLIENHSDTLRAYALYVTDKGLDAYYKYHHG